MKPSALALVAALFVGAAIVVASCSKSTSPSYGGGGGGGGGGGTPFDLHFPATGTSQQFTFPTAGTFAYHCTPHQSLGMTGSVIVSASASADSDTVAVGVNGSGGSAFLFTPSTVTIKPGGHVRWTNRSSMLIHTVTSP